MLEKEKYERKDIEGKHAFILGIALSYSFSILLLLIFLSDLPVTTDLKMAIGTPAGIMLTIFLIIMFRKFDKQDISNKDMDRYGIITMSVFGLSMVIFFELWLIYYNIFILFSITIGLAIFVPIGLVGLEIWLKRRIKWEREMSGFTSGTYYFVVVASNNFGNTTSNLIEITVLISPGGSNVNQVVKFLEDYWMFILVIAGSIVVISAISASKRKKATRGSKKQKKVPPTKTMQKSAGEYKPVPQLEQSTPPGTTVTATGSH